MTVSLTSTKAKNRVKLSRHEAAGLILTDEVIQLKPVNILEKTMCIMNSMRRFCFLQFKMFQSQLVTDFLTFYYLWTEPDVHISFCYAKLTSCRL